MNFISNSENLNTNYSNLTDADDIDFENIALIGEGLREDCLGFYKVWAEALELNNATWIKRTIIKELALNPQLYAQW